MNFDLIDEGVRLMLEQETGRPFGLSHLPLPQADRPYGVLYNITSSDEQGGYADPSDMLEVIYQTTSVGETNESCRWMVGQVYNALLRRENGFAVPIFIEGGEHCVVGRYLTSHGPILVSDEHTYTQADTYRIRVQHKAS